MRIGIVSDTHVPEAGKVLPKQMYDALKGVDLIMHAGDMHVVDVLDWLGEIAPVIGARGNGDGGPLRPPFPKNDPRVKDAHIVEAAGVVVGLTHGFLLPDEHPWTTREDLMERKLGRRVDVIVCRDTHLAYLGCHNGILYVNPGSPNNPRHLNALGQVAFLTLERGMATAQIIELAGWR